MLSGLESANDPLVFLQVEEQEDAERFLDEISRRLWGGDNM
jgi:hypothetical protein